MKQFSLRFKPSTDLLILLAYVCIGFIFYRNTADAKFLSDFYSWVGTYDEEGWAGLKDCFGYPGLHHLYHFAFLSAYTLFGLKAIYWHMLFVGLHCVNAVLCWKLICHLGSALNTRNASMIAFFGGLLFLISPYQTEAVVWGATIHYLFTTAFILLACIALIRFLQEDKLIYAGGAHLLFILGLFSLEIIFVLPLLTFVLFFLLKRRLEKHRYYRLILFPQILILIAFIALNKIFIGQVVGHYGAASHLNFNPELILGHFINYLLKFFTFFRYLPIEQKGKVIQFVQEQWLIWSFAAVMIGGAGWLTLRYKQSLKTDFSLHLLLSSFVLLIPVINLETPFVYDIQADRYGYVASAFFYPFVAAFVFTRLKRGHVPIMLILILISGVLLEKTTRVWEKAGVLAENLIEDFRWQQANKVFVLNMPDNYDGAYVFRNGFTVALGKRYDEVFHKKVKMVAWYNPSSLTDSIKLTVKSPASYVVEIGEPGQWFAFFGSTETEYYSATVYGSVWFDLDFKRIPENAYLIYHHKDGWRGFPLIAQ